MVGPGNLFCFVMIAMWMPLSIALFARYPAPRAAMLTAVGAMLLLPLRTAFDFPGVPSLDKELIPNIGILIGTMIFAGRRLRGMRLGRGADPLILVAIAGMFGTAYTNPDILVYGPRMIQAITTRDAISDSLFVVLNVAIPFVMGRILFRSSRDLHTLFLVLAGAGLVYSVLVLYEIRLSPQLHRKVYGFFQHSFHQTVRGDSFRPMVFMAHGLPLSFFVLVTAISATTLYRTRRRIGPVPAANAAAYLSLLLVLCRSVASIVYGLVLLPLVMFAKPKLQLSVAVVLAILVLTYPISRATGVFPTDDLIGITSSLDDSRAISLQYRFDNEDDLLEKIRQRIVFGWGGYSRFHIFDERGIHRSTTDGYWIIALGAYGAVGFVATFGLLTLPVFMARARISRIRSRRDQRMIASLGLIIAVYSVDLLPNGFYVSFYVLLCGALAGVVPGIIAEQRRDAAAARRRQRSGDAKPEAKVAAPAAASEPAATAPAATGPASLSAILRKRDR